MIKQSKGITLIALIITIILLLLLAGITISSLTGSGLFAKTQQASETYAEKSAREKLELELTNLVIEKETNPGYNSNEYLTQKLEEKEFIVNDDIVIVDGYQFKINREVPEILISLGKGNQTTEIKITATQTLATNYNSSIIKIEIEYDEDLKVIKLAGEELEVPEKVEGKYIIEKEVTTNGNYSIYVADANNGYALSNIQVTEISEDMTINNAEGLVAFRDRVNAGATYEGKTITLENDIDLSSVCYKVDGTQKNDKSWTPIGTSSVRFEGIFEGNYKTISNLYINTSTIVNSGLFWTIGENAIIQNLKMLDAYIYSNNSGNGSDTYTGTISGVNRGNIKKCANIKNKEDSQIYAYVYCSTSDYRGPYVGGITGMNSGIITECYNTSYIIGYSNGNNNRSCRVGGITGGNSKDATIKFCYNSGDLSNTGARFIMVGGITAENRGNLLNSYSSSNITTSSATYKYLCGIAARNWEDASGAIISDSYYETKSNITYAYNINNSSSWKSGFNKSATELQSVEMINLLNANSDDDYYCYDTDKINEGYPILKWQVNQQ